MATVARHATAAPLGEYAIRKSFREAEQRAGITHQKGRGLYGVRRRPVDAAKELGISREALQELGGWSDSQVPDEIYAAKERDYARDAARDIRAKIRGEED
jgi:hypothetical protein